MKSFLLLIVLMLSAAGFGQETNTYVFVHGAWDGGWDYRRVDALLSSQGNLVFRPTLTGLGDRVHLANPEVNLTTHISDVVNLIRFENISHVILVGHSYAGMVISGVAEQVPERIKQLIYLDAFVPNDGESIESIQSKKNDSGSHWEQKVAPFIKDGFIPYPREKTTLNPPYDVPQPLKTFTEPVKIGNPLVAEIPTTYILMTKNGKVWFEEWGASRARARGWKVTTFEGGHYPMRDQPEELVKKLKSVVNSK